MPARAVRMAVAAAHHVIGHPGHTAIVIATVAVPGCGAIAHGGVGAAHHGEATECLLGLLPAFPAGDELEDVGHRHSLFGARTARGTDIFVKSHGQIVSAGGARVKLAAATGLSGAQLVDRAVGDAHHRPGLVRDDEHIEINKLVALAFEEIGDDCRASQAVTWMRG